jgi:hypothetical protein
VSFISAAQAQVTPPARSVLVLLKSFVLLTCFSRQLWLPLRGSECTGGLRFLISEGPLRYVTKNLRVSNGSAPTFGGWLRQCPLGSSADRSSHYPRR